MQARVLHLHPLPSPRPEPAAQAAPGRWDAVRASLRGSLGEAADRNWLSKLTEAPSEAGDLVLSAPNRLVRDWVTTHYAHKIRAAAAEVYGSLVNVRVVTQAVQARYEPESAVPASAMASAAPVAAKEPEQTLLAAQAPAEEDLLSSPLDPGMTFASFVVGESNMMAYRAARALCEEHSLLPGGHSLFLYAPVGYGKTHLLQAVAHEMRSRFAGGRIIYMTAEKFMYRYVGALRAGGMMQFKERFRTTDTLIIDDVQFICGKESTQEEFFHTVNALLDGKKRVVIAADRAPAALDGLHDRLKSRFSGGLTVTLDKPDADLRRRILTAKRAACASAMDGGAVTDDAADWLAANVTGSIRDLEGALNRLIAKAAYTGRAINAFEARESLPDMFAACSRQISVQDIQKKTADYFGVTTADLLSAGRSRSVALPRQVAMYFAKKLTPRSYAEIARGFQKKDHTTIMHAFKKIEEMAESDLDFASDLQRLESAIRQ